jgi:hypothetical protein
MNHRDTEDSEKKRVSEGMGERNHAADSILKRSTGEREEDLLNSSTQTPIRSAFYSSLLCVLCASVVQFLFL